MLRCILSWVFESHISPAMMPSPVRRRVGQCKDQRWVLVLGSGTPWT